MNNNTVAKAKANMLDLLLEIKEEAEKAKIEINEWKSVVLNVINLLDLKDPSADQLYAKIKSMCNALEDSGKTTIPSNSAPINIKTQPEKNND